MAKQPSLASQMASLAAAAVTEAAQSRVTLDFSAESVKGVEDLIAATERDARIFQDLPDDARVAEDVADLLDLDALGAYYGELFVRHSGEAWGESECEGRQQSAVTRGAVTVHPRDTIRRRVYDGRHVDLEKIFRQESRELAKQQG